MNEKAGSGQPLSLGQFSLEEDRARQVYHITPAGVLDALSIPRRCYLLLQLGLANLPFISPQRRWRRSGSTRPS